MPNGLIGGRNKGASCLVSVDLGDCVVRLAMVTSAHNPFVRSKEGVSTREAEPAKSDKELNPAGTSLSGGGASSKGDDDTSTEVST